MSSPEKFKILFALFSAKNSTAFIDDFAAAAGLEKTSLKIGFTPTPILNLFFSNSDKF